jgi:thioredoxin 2
MGSDFLILRCDSCGAGNRIPRNRLDDRPVCGRCRSPLKVSSGTRKVTDDTFRQSVLSSPIPVLVDCWAPWCGPCRSLSPVLDELARDYSGKVTIAKLNIDENPATAAKFQIRSVPTMLLFNGGREVDRLVGAMPRARIEQALKTAGA